MAKNAKRLKKDLATVHLHNTDILINDLLQKPSEAIVFFIIFL